MELKTIDELLKEDLEAKRKAWEEMPTIEELCREIEAEMQRTGKTFNDC